MNLLFQRRPSLFAPVLQRDGGESKAGHAPPCEVPSSYMLPRAPSPPPAVLLPLHVSSSISACALNFEGSRAKGVSLSVCLSACVCVSGKGGGGGIKDGDEGEVVQYATHHTGTRCLLSSGSLRARAQYRSGPRAGIFWPTDRTLHRKANAHTITAEQRGIPSSSPHLSNYIARSAEAECKQRQLSAGLINLSIILHAVLCNLMNY